MSVLQKGRRDPMTIRFLQTVRSENSEFPFAAGQVIHVTAPSLFLLELCDGVRAEIVREDETERAVEVIAEQPEPKPRKRSKRVH